MTMDLVMLRVNRNLKKVISETMRQIHHFLIFCVSDQLTTACGKKK